MFGGDNCGRERRDPKFLVWDSRCGTSLGREGFNDRGGMIPVVIPAGTAIEWDTLEALIGLVGGCMGSRDGMLPEVVAVAKHGN